METSSTKRSADEQPAATPPPERRGGFIPGAVASQGCCGTAGSGAGCCGEPAATTTTATSTPSGCCGPAATPTTIDKQDILTIVRERYGTVAIEVLANNSSGCCDSACCGSAGDSSITQNLYLADELEGLPLKAALASLGCGNPTALAELRPGEVVLDLGSGGGYEPTSAGHSIEHLRYIR